MRGNESGRLKLPRYRAGKSISARRSQPFAWTEPQFDGEAGGFPFHLLPCASTVFYDGSTAHLPWLQEMPDPLTSAMWSNWIEINPTTAGRLQVATHDMVEVTSRHGSVHAPVVVTPGIAPDIVAMPIGQGHESFTRYASHRGSNPISILAPMMEPQTGAMAWGATRVRITRVSDGRGELILLRAASSSTRTSIGDVQGAERKFDRASSRAVGHGGRSRPMYRLRRMRDSVPRGKQHPHRWSGSGGARARHALASCGALLGRRIS